MYVVDLEDLSRSFSRTDIELQRLILNYLSYLQRLLVRPSAHRFLKHSELNIDLHENIRKMALNAQHIAYHTIVTSYAWIDSQAHSNQSTRNCVQKRIVLGLQRYNP